MIGKRQLALVEHARTQVRLSPAEFADLVREEGRVSSPAELSVAGFNGLMDRLTTYGFRDRRRAVLSAITLTAVKGMFDGLAITPLEADTLLRRHGEVGDLRDLDGDGLLRLLIAFERRKAPVAAFIAARRCATPKQLALMHVARRQVQCSENDVSWTLQHLGGVNTAADLDQRGFDLMMAVMRNKGFRAAVAAEPKPAFGERPGFASPPQVALIRDLWAEWSGATDEAALNAWLERSYHVSTLRFLTAATASKAITALKAMKRRAAEASQANA